MSDSSWPGCTLSAPHLFCVGGLFRSVLFLDQVTALGTGVPKGSSMPLPFLAGQFSGLHTAKGQRCVQAKETPWCEFGELGP